MRVLGIVLAAAVLVPSGAGGSAARSPDEAAPRFDVDTDDAVPRGMVAYFTTSACPAGWVPEELATGRLVVATTDPVAIGRTVGSPLGPAEDRTHAHPIAATMALPGKSISAADGSNNQGASSGDRAVAGVAGASPSGLPFVQLTACVRS